MNTEEDEFKRIEREALRRAARDEDDDDTQEYTSEMRQLLAEAYRCGFEAGAAAEREACANLCESHVRYPSRLNFSAAIRARSQV